MRRAASRVRDGGQLLALAGFLLGIALLTVTAGISLVDAGEHQLLQSQPKGTTTLEEFKSARARLLDFFATRPADVDVSVLEEDLRLYLENSFGAKRARSSEVNVTVAKEGALDGADRVADELSFIGPGPCGASCYNAVADDGTDFSSFAYDGTNDGMIYNAAGELIGAFVRFEVRGPTERLTEIVVIAFGGV